VPAGPGEDAPTRIEHCRRRAARHEAPVDKSDLIYAIARHADISKAAAA
jgi:hypothetical protein